MSAPAFDLVVIGGGSAGVRAARTAASLGAKVALVEDREELGGTCVNVGCVPKKLFWYAAHFHEELVDAAGFGWRVGEAAFDWPTLRANKDKEIARLNGVYQRLLETSGVEIVRGRARVTSPHEVTVALAAAQPDASGPERGDGGERVLTARFLLVATGGAPVVPSIPGAAHAVVSDQIFHLATWPKRVAIVGAGYIAVEFAGIFRGTGAEVHLLVRGDGILRSFDEDISALLRDEMKARGIDVRLHTEASEIVDVGTHKRVHVLTKGSTSNTGSLDVDLVLLATGRAPRTRGLFADGVRVALEESGSVQVDARFRTNIDSIYAVGDVVDHPNLTPVALAQGTLVARNLFGNQAHASDWTNIATAVFSDPNVGTVGLTEKQARAQLEKTVVYRSMFTPMKNTLSGRRETTMMKLVVDGTTDRVVGVHMVGPSAGEIIQGFAVALTCGATKAQLDATIGIHPTAAEELVTMRTVHATYARDP